MAYHICRVCKWAEYESGPSGVTGMPAISKFPFIRYGARHWAHADCGLKKHGMKFLEGLSTGQVENFPIMACRAAGLPGAISAELNRRSAMHPQSRAALDTPNLGETVESDLEQARRSRAV